VPDIVVRGAREHNLKDLTVRLPRDRLVVITGPSGSGKSSLAFDTIYAEGRRRYVESLSVYARQFLGQMPKPDVDSIEGLSPTISVRQQGGSRNPRSTVGTLTEIYDYLRLLYARVGEPKSPVTGKPLRAFTVPQVVDRLLALPEETRIVLLAPIVRDQPGDCAQVLKQLRQDGFVRAEIDGQTRDLGDDIALSTRTKHTIEAHIDRLKVKESARKRMSEAVELAYKKSAGFVHVIGDGGFDWTASEKLVCIETGEVYPDITPRTFSFNSAEGACPACGGLGRVHELDPDLVIAEPTLSLREGAVAAWGRPESAQYQAKLEALAAATGVDIDKPFTKLSAAVQKRLLYGDPKKHDDDSPSAGILPVLNRRMKEIARRKGDTSLEDAVSAIEDEVLRFARERRCSECDGTRLSPLARAVTVQDRSLPWLTSLSLRELSAFFAELRLQGSSAEVVRRLVFDVTTRLSALIDLGLDYLSLDRGVLTLSGGEVERIRLATQIGSGLMGVLYVLDEPSSGLHARDNERLIQSLTKLRDQGNSLLIVEHDEATIRRADYVLDLGPRAGRLGGEIVAQGTPAELANNPASPTGRYLAGKDVIAVPSTRRTPKRWFEIERVTQHNLHEVTGRFPIGAFSCVTGVSGSGKSSLVMDALLPSLKVFLRGRGEPPFLLKGADAFDRVIDVDQSPIGRTPRSSPLSYIGAFDELRDLFSSLPEARVRGYGPARFSFNVKGGRCEACRGDGVVRVDMQFLPDEFVRCETCGGRRYDRETLEVRYRGHSIADVLDMSASDARELFAPVPRLSQKLSALCDVGLGYLSLGQSATTLSGGESQRVKLARELARRVTGKTLLILDEPTTGLHFVDVAVLVDLLQRLTDAGNTILVIEHHLDVIKLADHVIDMGPEGGPGGGHIVVAGTPEQVAAHPGSHTGRYLRDVLKPSRS
jgi:excinuclease ABC subunit A